MTDVLAVEILPAASANLTVRTPPAVTAACKAVVVVFPRAKVTVVSVEEIVLSVAMETPSRYNVAEPPVASPATIVAVAVRSVFVAVSLLLTVVPPTPTEIKEVGATGAMVSTTMAALALSEPVEPGAITARLAAFPEASLMVPPLRANAPLDETSRSLLKSPA